MSAASAAYGALRATTDDRRKPVAGCGSRSGPDHRRSGGRGLEAALDSRQADLSLTFRTLADQLDESIRQERLLARLSGFFARRGLLPARRAARIDPAVAQRRA